MKDKNGAIVIVDVGIRPYRDYYHPSKNLIWACNACKYELPLHNTVLVEHQLKQHNIKVEF